MTVRNKIVDSMMNYGRLVTSKKKNAEDEKMTYKMYYDYSENVSRIATHRIMAIDRGEKKRSSLSLSTLMKIISRHLFQDVILSSLRVQQLNT